MNYVAIIGGGLFGALSGSALAGTAVLGKVLGAEMRRQHYNKEFQIGPIVSGGTLAMIIPPSLIVVVLGSQATISISKLLLGGLVPGVCLILGYSIWNVIRTASRPEFSPIESVEMSAAQRIKAILLMLPFALIVFLVTGIIWIGVATPSESAAMGCLGLLILSWSYKRKFDWFALQQAIKQSIGVTGLVMMIIMSASGFSRLLAFSGATPGFVNFMATWSESQLTILIFSQLAVLFLGMWLDSIAIIILIAPLLAPLIETAGIDPVWFGMITMTNLLLGGKSPPFGLCLFVLKGVNPELTIAEIYRAVIPYLIVDGLVIVAIIVFPKVFLLLPYMFD